MKQCDTLEKMIKLSADDRERAGKVVSRSFFRILVRNGFSHSDIMNFAGHLLDEVMRDMRAKSLEEVDVSRTDDERDVA